MLNLMRQKIYLVIAVLVLSLTVSAQKDNWLRKLEKIKPLVSVEKDVEKILGKATDRYADVGEYETKESLFTVTYSEGRCKSTITPKYNVDKQVVITIDFRPKKKIVFSLLNLDLSKFSVEETNDVEPTISTYSNLDIGINYTVQKNILNYVEVYPSNDFSYLECSEQSKSNNQ